MRRDNGSTRATPNAGSACSRSNAQPSTRCSVQSESRNKTRHHAFEDSHGQSRSTGNSCVRSSWRSSFPRIPFSSGLSAAAALANRTAPKLRMMMRSILGFPHRKCAVIIAETVEMDRSPLRQCRIRPNFLFKHRRQYEIMVQTAQTVRGSPDRKQCHAYVFAH